MTRDEALQTYHDAMTYACDDADRQACLRTLAAHLGDASEAERLHRDYMAQWRADMRELRAN